MRNLYSRNKPSSTEKKRENFSGSATIVPMLLLFFLVFSGIQRLPTQLKLMATSMGASKVEKKPAVSVRTQPTSTKKILLPDLTFIPGSLATVPGTPLAGTSEVGDTLLQVEVRNLGDGTARDFSVAFVICQGEIQLKTLRNKKIALLPAKASIALSEPVKAFILPPAGTYRLKALVDCYPTSVTEVDERNNKVEIPLSIIGPDFVIANSDIELSPVSPRSGQSVTARVPVRNNGTGRGVLFIFMSLHDSSGRLLQEASSWREIQAGGFIFLEKEFLLPSGYGDYKVRFEADRDGRNPEPNEDDNRGEKFFSASLR